MYNVEILALSVYTVLRGLMRGRGSSNQNWPRAVGIQGFRVQGQGFGVQGLGCISQHNFLGTVKRINFQGIPTCLDFEFGVTLENVGFAHLGMLVSFAHQHGSRLHISPNGGPSPAWKTSILSSLGHTVSKHQSRRYVDPKCLNVCMNIANFTATKEDRKQIPWS